MKRLALKFGGTSVGSSTALSGAHKKGDLYINVDSASTFSVDDYIVINYNKYEVDIYNDRFPVTILGIQKYVTMTCDIYIDKIWKFNDQYICKWKVRNIFVH